MWRIDRIGRAMIDIMNTVHDLLAPGVSIRSVSDGIDPSTREGQMQLNLMATFAEYERELIQERVRASVGAAKARGSQVRPISAHPQKVRSELRTVQHLIDAEGLGVVEAARTVGWSKATYDQHRSAVA